MLHLTDPLALFVIVYGALILPALLSGILLRAITFDLSGWDSVGLKIVNVFYYTLFVGTTVLLVVIINELESIYRTFEPINAWEKFVLVALLQTIAYLLTLRKED